MGSSFCRSSQGGRLTSPRISCQPGRDFRNRLAFQPAPEARLPGAGAGRAIPAALDKLQESLKIPANMALQSRQPWDTNSPIDTNPTKGDAPTNSCSEPYFC